MPQKKSVPKYWQDGHVFRGESIHHNSDDNVARKMRTSMFRSVESAIRRVSTSSPSTSTSSTHFARQCLSSESTPARKVAVLGAAGGIGQPLALLMKLNPLVSSLSLYDIAGTPGVAAVVSHINTRSEVAGYKSEDQLAQALDGCDLVIIPAGVPRKPGITR
ncbi:hypothetical protein MKW98_030126 [Papaver atlanticum]|uniref:malate dehydrogenase n=1 Tax=Papaver atlanticum TaxID=357466 RepID=A0AAD4T733_9MAGN|nr:hypothetical protein MKW98_030126 [Papaver atlanticum]